MRCAYALFFFWLQWFSCRTVDYTVKLPMEAEERGVVSLEPLAEALRSPARIAATGFSAGFAGFATAAIVFSAGFAGFAVARIIEAVKK